jgi:hypothetical protein
MLRIGHCEDRFILIMLDLKVAQDSILVLIIANFESWATNYIREGKMKRAIFFIIAIILCSFTSQLLALPEGAVARLGLGGVSEVTFSPNGKMLAVASTTGTDGI